MIKQEVKNGE